MPFAVLALTSTTKELAMPTLSRVRVGTAVHAKAHTARQRGGAADRLVESTLVDRGDEPLT